MNKVFANKMTREDWENTFKPGERIPFLHDPAIRAADPLTVWTELDVDGKTIIVNDYHVVNREAYYICAVPFNKGDFIEVEDEFADDEDELDEAED